MFSEQSEKLVKELIQAEYKHACTQFGEKYNSLHEGYAVLLEEVEEVKSEVEKLSANLDVLWRKIKSNDTDIESLVHEKQPLGYNTRIGTSWSSSQENTKYFGG